MTHEWNLDRIIKPDDPSQWAYDLSYSASALIHVARLALDNETRCDGGTSVEGRAAASNTLEIAQALLVTVIEGTESLSRKAEAGFWKKEDAA
ncbi:MAG: hypothetical protein ACK5II_08450 [Paracoccus sp. (in: a-proteobacteria)]